MVWLWEDMKDNPTYARLTGSPDAIIARETQV